MLTCQDFKTTTLYRSLGPQTSWRPLDLLVSLYEIKEGGSLQWRHFSLGSSAEQQARVPVWVKGIGLRGNLEKTTSEIIALVDLERGVRFLLARIQTTGRGTGPISRTG